jgi:hypothetical protein
VDVWYACNPSLGYLIDEEFLSGQWRVFQSSGRPAAFATEHLGLWPNSAATQWVVIPKSSWADAKDADSTVQDPVAFAATVSTDRQWANIGVAGVRTDGLRHVELMDRRPGTGWVVDRLVELTERWKPCAVVIDAGGPAGSLVAAAEEAKLPMIKPSVRDVVAAAGSFYDGVCPADGKSLVRHIGQPDLDAAVAAAVKRKLGAAWAWDQMAAAVDISPLIAVTNALWGYATRAQESTEAWVMYG